MAGRMSPIGTKKKFGSKIYTATGHYDSKSEAMRQAKIVRKYGGLARLTRVSNKAGRTFYTTWTRDK